MSSFSIWHWLIVLLVIGVAGWLIAKSIRNRQSSTQLSGIGGWLAFLAFGLCLGLLRNLSDFVKGLPDVQAGWEAAPAARGHLALVLILSVAFLVANVWAIICLFKKKRSFKNAYIALWVLAGVVPLSTLTMLSLPGVTLEMILPPEEIGRSIAAVCIMGLWFWYLRVSERVHNTMVN